jgi:type II secretory pathway component GspD/PulD (secretin)
LKKTPIQEQQFRPKTERDIVMPIMNKKLLPIVVIVVAFLGPIAILKAEQQESRPTISNVFIDTDLRQALQDIGVQTGVNIILDQRVGGIITAELDKVSLEHAIEILLAGTEFEVIKFDGYYLVFSPLESSDSFSRTSSLTRVKVNHLTAAEARSQLSGYFQNYVRQDEVSNSLSITASPQLTDRIIQDLKTIDIPRQHVLLDARMVVLEHAGMLSLGVEWTLPTIVAGIGTVGMLGESVAGGGWPLGIQIGYSATAGFTNSLRMALRLMEQNNEASVISSPQVMGQEGSTATIRVTTEEYFEIYGDGTSQSRSQLEKIETGALLRITPRIGDDGSVLLKVEVDVSDVASRGERNLPVISRRAAGTTVRVESGGTVAIAGLMDSRSQRSEGGFPVLSRIPLIRRFFGTESSSDGNRQVAVFVTATIVDGDDDTPDPDTPDRSAGRPVNEEQFRKELRNILDNMENE